MALVVNGETVDDAELREEVRNLRPRYNEMMQGGGEPIALEAQLREWCRENVIERVLMRQEAARRSLTLEALSESIAAKVSPPRYKDVGEFYRKNKESFLMPELVHAAHIIRNVDENGNEEQAREILRKAEEELKAGTPFAAVADKYSDCPGEGGDLGWFQREQMVPEFEEVVFQLRPGETSGIFRTAFGFHIAHVYDHRQAGIPGLMDVRKQIEEALMKQKQQAALERFVDALKAHARIEG